jgi:hypothetical protein
MDPQLKSYLTSFALMGATAVASWAATRGYITPDQQSALATGLVTLAGSLVMAAVTEYKKRQVSQPAMIKAVNEADNGVKVVASTEPAPAVSSPLK